MPPKTPTQGNLLLARMERADRALLTPLLEPVDLPLRFQMETRNRTIGYAYFLEDGLSSIVAKGANDSNIEVGIIGAEGMTGISVVMGADRAPHDTFMQVAGNGLRITAANLCSALKRSPDLQKLLLRFAHAFFVQTAYTALSNGRSKTEERLARWLLMAHDRLKRDEVPLTHEFLALMLGVHRPGVTGAIKSLAAQGLIQAKRGGTRVLDREGLKKASNGAYGPAEAELARLFSEGRR